jgi:CDP-4-dehydro-6-deoxyglucose reductase, E1
MKYPLMRNNILREDLDNVIEHLSNNDPILTNGPKICEFESLWSEWLGVKYSVFLNSGASSNLLSMALLKLKFPEGGEVVVPPLTWISDISSVIQNGFIPIFADINPTTLGMCDEEIIKKISSSTKAVFLSHIQGFNALSDKLIAELDERNIYLIEDVCESHGATHKGKKAGSIGWVSNFSFYYAHHMSTIEGGMLCTNDSIVYEQARMLRSHGMLRESRDEENKKKIISENPELNPDFIFMYPAYNVRNTEIGGILGISQLKRLDQIIKKRTQNLEYFLNAIDSSIYQTNFKVEGSSNYAFNLILKDADKIKVEKLMRLMRDNEIEYRRGSAGGGNQLRQPYLRGIIPPNYHQEFKNTEHVHFYGFYIGNYPDLSFKEIDQIADVLNQL